MDYCSDWEHIDTYYYSYYTSTSSYTVNGGGYSAIFDTVGGTSSSDRDGDGWPDPTRPKEEVIHEEDEVAAAGINCNSFSFVSTSSNWQEAGVKNQRIKIKWLPGGYTAVINIPGQIVIDLPVARSNGVYYSAGKAAELVAKAIQYASDDVYKLYQNHPYLPSNEFFISEFRRLVDL
jgi:hypothetical protein